MVSLDEAVIARLHTHGEQLEVYVDPEKAIAIRDRKEIDLTDLLAVPTVFKDAKKGKKASTEKIEEIFGTSNPIEVAQKIIRRGELQLTTEHRRKMQEEKKKKIVNLITRRTINSQTGVPHPPKRIERAMAEAGVHIDPFVGVEEQATRIIKELRPYLPLKIEKVQVAVRITPEHISKAYGFVRNYGELKEEEWQKDGSWIGLVEIPGGLQDEFYEKIAELTKGDVETRLVKRTE